MVDSLSTSVRAFLTRRLDPVLVASYVAIATLLVVVVGGAGLVVAGLLGGQ